MPCESYCQRFRSLLLCSCDACWVVISSLFCCCCCWFYIAQLKCRMATIKPCHFRPPQVQNDKHFLTHSLMERLTLDSSMGATRILYKYLALPDSYACENESYNCMSSWHSLTCALAQSSRIALLDLYRRILLERVKQLTLPDLYTCSAQENSSETAWSSRMRAMLVQVANTP